MAEAPKIITVKAASLGYAEVGSGEVFTPLTGVIAGLAITQEAPTLTNIEHEFSDTPLLIIPTSGTFKVTFDLGQFSPTDIAALDGGTFDAATGVYTPPAAAEIIYKKFKLTFGAGMKDLIIHKGQLATNWDGTDLKTSPVKLHVEITALIGDDGKSYAWTMAAPASAGI